MDSDPPDMMAQLKAECRWLDAECRNGRIIGIRRFGMIIRVKETGLTEVEVVSSIADIIPLVDILIQPPSKIVSQTFA